MNIEMMLETVAVCVIVVTGVLAIAQAYFVGKCFEGGQPREGSHFNNEILNNSVSRILVSFCEFFLSLMHQIKPDGL